MFYMIGSNIMFNMMEYFSFINVCLLFLFIIISMFFILIKSTLLIYSNMNINHCLMEFTSTLFSLLFLMLMITPALIMLLDFDLMMLPSFIMYSLGLQWAFQFNMIFLPVNFGFESYCDHYIIASKNKSLMNTKIKNQYLLFLKSSNQYLPKPSNNTLINMDQLLLLIYRSIFNLFFIDYYKGQKYPIIDHYLVINQYLFDISQYILLPIYSFIRLFVYSFDVIHTLGFYSWGIKIDAIPGSVNLANTLSVLCKGEYSGKCFELCGQGHVSTMINALIISYYFMLIQGF